MRRLLGLMVVSVMFVVQLGFAHATVCRSLMGRKAVPVESHCASMKTKAAPGCAGMAGCKDLCKRENPAAPQATGKTALDAAVSSHAGALVAQVPVARVIGIPSGGAFWRILERTAFRDRRPPHTFLLHHAFLI